MPNPKKTQLVLHVMSNTSSPCASQDSRHKLIRLQFVVGRPVSEDVCEDDSVASSVFRAVPDMCEDDPVASSAFRAVPGLHSLMQYHIYCWHKDPKPPLGLRL